MATLFLVEDHAIMRRALHMLLQREPDFSIVGEAASGEEALAELENLATLPDLVVLDISLPNMSGLDLLSELQSRWPSLPCVVLSGHDRSVYVERARSAGARAYIHKSAVHEIVPGIRNLLNGVQNW